MRGVHQRLHHLLRNAADQAQGVMRWVTLQLAGHYDVPEKTLKLHVPFCGSLINWVTVRYVALLSNAAFQSAASCTMIHLITL